MCPLIPWFVEHPYLRSEFCQKRMLLEGGGGLCAPWEEREATAQRGVIGSNNTASGPDGISPIAKTYCSQHIHLPWPVLAKSLKFPQTHLVNAHKIEGINKR